MTNANSKEEVDNIDEIAEAIFSKPPGPPNSVQLQLEDLTAEIAEQEGVDNFVFNILCLLTFKGMQKLYGHKNIIELNEREFLNILDYVKSYGYTLEIRANDTDYTPWQLQSRGIPVRRYNIFFDKLY